MVDVDALLATYRGWLARQALAARSREADAAQDAGFRAWLGCCEHGAGALSDSHVRDWAVRDWAARDYKRHVKTESRWAPASVNQAVAAIDNFYRSLGAGRPDIAREDLPQLAPRAPEEDEQQRFLRAVEASPSPRDRVLLHRPATMRARRPGVGGRVGDGSTGDGAPRRVPRAGGATSSRARARGM
ncbi:hypothetical protein [Gaiella sp.]|uniref:hypothetical protein n=1 Tax=Gaiella sp. TaxID=2663207 RepID=UPI003983ADEC